MQKIKSERKHSDLKNTMKSQSDLKCCDFQKTVILEAECGVVLSLTGEFYNPNDFVDEFSGIKRNQFRYNDMYVCIGITKCQK